MNNRANTERLLMCKVITAYSQHGYASDAFRTAMTEFSAHTGLIGQDAEKHCLKLAKQMIEKGERKDERTQKRDCVGCTR